MKLTLRMLLSDGSLRLSEAGIAEHELDARYMLLECFHTDMAHYLMNQNVALPDDGMTQQAAIRYLEMVEQRAARIPLQQLLGSREFMGMEFKVNEHVLIPRQDTETLVEEVLKDYKGRNPQILDLCTGSGCIAISLSVLGGFDRVTGSDISEEALKVAAWNGKQLADSRVQFVKSDLFEAWDQEGITDRTMDQFDVIVSNPPYIPTGVIEGLEPEVRDHEPVLALDGKEDGLYFYRRIAKECGNFLKPGGAVYLEIGYDQAEDVSDLLREAGFGSIRVIKDAPGLDRVVRGDFMRKG